MEKTKNVPLVKEIPGNDTTIATYRDTNGKNTIITTSPPVIQIDSEMWREYDDDRVSMRANASKTCVISLPANSTSNNTQFRILIDTGYLYLGYLIDGGKPISFKLENIDDGKKKNVFESTSRNNFEHTIDSSGKDTYTLPGESGLHRLRVTVSTDFRTVTVKDLDAHGFFESIVARICEDGAISYEVKDVGGFGADVTMRVEDAPDPKLSGRTFDNNECGSRVHAKNTWHYGTEKEECKSHYDEANVVKKNADGTYELRFNNGSMSDKVPTYNIREFNPIVQFTTDRVHTIN